MRSSWVFPSPVWMGILNVSPNSFSDSSRFQNADDALHRAYELVKNGAHVLDIGAVATNPSVENCLIPASEELARLLPPIRKIRAALPHIPISVDTFSSQVALSLAQEGLIDIVNDVYAARKEEEGLTTAHVAGQFGLGFVAMHMAGSLSSLSPPPSSSCPPHSFDLAEDPMGGVIDFLQERVSFIRSCGVTFLLVDPGIGSGRFGKSTQQSYTLLEATAIARLQQSFPGTALLVGVSRKKFIRDTLKDNASPEEIDHLSKKIEFEAIQNGVQWIRSHKMPQEM